MVTREELLKIIRKCYAKKGNTVKRIKDVD